MKLLVSGKKKNSSRWLIKFPPFKIRPHVFRVFRICSLRHRRVLRSDVCPGHPARCVQRRALTPGTEDRGMRQFTLQDIQGDRYEGAMGLCCEWVTLNLRLLSFPSGMEVGVGSSKVNLSTTRKRWLRVCLSVCLSFSVNTIFLADNYRFVSHSRMNLHDRAPRLDHRTLSLWNNDDLSPSEKKIYFMQTLMRNRWRRAWRWRSREWR